ncbi:hypothetical protein G1C95_0907 [Bifidobacterium sp. DSM 109957]|uniref:Uncharacterized protein n=1 Tax=Bifidobacterium oedipodis TaxID=2675322 RepID=A0A7Y0HT44_9BIFI|nr:hypothetical protein [Bifidobacterium sp. DSM 109957]
MTAGVVLTLVMLALVPLKPVWRPKLCALLEQTGSRADTGECAPAEATTV